jgi:hypothetical protein
MFSRNSRIVILLFCSANSLIQICSSIDILNTEEVEDKVLRIDQNSEKDYSKILNIESWHFTRFPALHGCYRQFLKDQKEYFDDPDMSKYSIHTSIEREGNFLHEDIKNFKYLLWYKLTSASSESSFVYSYFSLIWRDYCTSKLQFTVQSMAGGDLKPHHNKYLKAQERVIGYLQNFFHKRIYLLPLDNSAEEIKQTYPLYQVKQNAIEKGSRLLIARFLEYCQEHEDNRLQLISGNKASDIDQAFSILLDTLHDLQNRKIPEITKSFLDQLFPINAVDTEVRVHQRLITNWYNEFTVPGYMNVKTDTLEGDSDMHWYRVHIIINHLVVFEQVQHMCPSGSIPDHKEIADEFNRNLYMTNPHSDHTRCEARQPGCNPDPLFKYHKMRFCPPFYRQASSMLTFPVRFKDILSDNDIKEFTNFYSQAITKCYEDTLEVRPIAWPKCPAPNFEPPAVPIETLSYTTASSLEPPEAFKKEPYYIIYRKNVKEIVQIRSLDEPNADEWAMVQLVLEWAYRNCLNYYCTEKCLGLGKERIDKFNSTKGTLGRAFTYIDQSMDSYFERRFGLLKRYRDEEEKRGSIQRQKKLSSTAIGENKSLDDNSRTASSSKAKPSARKRASLKKKITAVAVSEKLSDKIESADGPVIPGPSQMSNYPSEDDLQNRNFKNDGIRGIEPPNKADEKMVESPAIGETELSDLGSSTNDPIQLEKLSIPETDHMSLTDSDAAHGAVGPPGAVKKTDDPEPTAKNDTGPVSKTSSSTKMKHRKPFKHGRKSKLRKGSTMLDNVAPRVDIDSGASIHHSDDQPGRNGSDDAILRDSNVIHLDNIPPLPKPNENPPAQASPNHIITEDPGSASDAPEPPFIIPEHPITQTPDPVVSDSLVGTADSLLLPPSLVDAQAGNSEFIRDTERNNQDTKAAVKTAAVNLRLQAPIDLQQEKADNADTTSVGSEVDSEIR